VYNFLGHVNQFKSHVSNGEANIGGLNIKLEKENQQADGAALAYIRPHDIDVQRVKNSTAPAFEAKVNYIHAIGPLVRLELQQLGQDAIIEAELTQERFRELGLNTGEQVFVYPRNVRVFEDHSAAS
jgi:sulfate transport system ATP-binding protein